MANSALVNLPEKVRDRDVFHDRTGCVYVTLGHLQPYDRILSILKYLPDPNGRWQADNTRYRRLFRGGVASAVEGMNQAPSEYLVRDPHFGATLLEVPRNHVTKYFSPERRLKEILSHETNDALEESARRMSEVLHDVLGIPFDRLGVTGSIAWNAHNTAFSDINMNIYGLEMSKRLQEGYDSVAEQNGHVRLREISEWKRTMSNILARIPSYLADDLRTLFRRKKELYYGEQYIGVTPVLLPNEAPIKYGSESYESLRSKPITIEMDIQKDDYGIFMPAIYEGTSSPVAQIDGTRVTRIMVYDGSFRGLFREGDRVEVVGSLQKVAPARLGHNGGGSTEFYQIMVGTKQGIGRELVRIIES
ncbi:MAG: hypothetical protein KAW94_02005 [Candidatus Thorarchaeota archaeon]|nr:hypothetical protein [Candidatus Thorarchaeota archaeon]